MRLLVSESRTMNLGILNIHVVWRPMTLSESGLQKTWKSSLASEHLVKCVKVCLRDIGFFQGYNDMETGQSEFCLSILLQFKIF